MEFKGRFFTGYVPEKWKIEIEHLGENRYRLRYSETFAENTPEEAFQNTLKISRTIGIPLKKRGKTVYFAKEGSKDEIFGYVALEAFGLTKIADITLRELLLFVPATIYAMERHNAKDE